MSSHNPAAIDQQPRATAQINAEFDEFRRQHGFGPGDTVRYTLRHPTHVFTITDVALQGNGEPLAWLTGVSGAVPLHLLSHLDDGGTDA